MSRRRFTESARTRASRAALLGALAFVVPTSTTGQTVRAVSGRALDARDSLPLSGVVIRLLGHPQTTRSGADGRFRLERVPSAPVRLTFERLGLVPDTVTVPVGDTMVVAYLRTRAVELPPVTGAVALSARERFERAALTSTVTLAPTELKAVPALAEPDVARVVQLLPGTVARHDFSTALNVRGGEDDQNLIRLDGVPLFNPTHVGGLFSTFDTEAIRGAEFITGGFPAGYGGRLSSVLDVSVRDGAPKTEVRGALSVLAAKLLVEGPLLGTGATYLVGARRTYADALADNFTDDPFTYYFYDGIAKITVPFRRGGSVAVTGYVGHDDLEAPWTEPSPNTDGIDLEMDWGNRLAGATLLLPIGLTVLEQRASVSQFTGRQAFVPDGSSFKNSALVWSLHTALRAGLGARHQLQLGGGWERYDLHYRTREEGIDQDVADVRYLPTVWSAFIDAQLRPVDAVLVRPGARLEHVTGADVTSIAPRVAVKAFLTPDFALIGSGGRYYQAVQSISDQELPVNIFEVWIGADARTPVAQSDHLVLGFERWFGADWSVTVEGYLKSFDGLLIDNDADDPKVIGDEFLRADGDAKGLDVLLRRHAGTLRGWIAYSLAKTERRTATGVFVPAHDRRHSLDLVLEAPGPWGGRLGVRWGYGSPLPYTSIEGAWLHREYDPLSNAYDDFATESVGGRMNAERFPHYSRLDLSLRWEFEKWGARWRPFVQLLNIYNRRNVFVYRFDYRDVPPTRSGTTQLPLLATVGVEFQF